MTPQATIVPHLWFDQEAVEAAEFYTSLLPHSAVTHVTTLRDTPSGDTTLVSFTLAGQPFMAISAGPLFAFNPSISFHLKCQTPDDVEALWAPLSEGGTVLMPLDSYPWSPRYGWLQDRYGLSWQVSQVDEEELAQRITPMLMFVGAVCGKAEEAVDFYVSVFEDSEVHDIARYGADAAPDQAGTVQYAAFSLLNMQFSAMDSAQNHDFAFNEAISFLVECHTQAEIDTYWEKLSAVPEAEQCGWLKDKFGVSWQIVPAALDNMLQRDEATVARVMQAVLQMKKIDLAALQSASASA